MLVDSNSRSEERRRHLKSIGHRPGIIYCSCKVQKKCVDNCPPFRPNLSALQTPTYKLAKDLVSILESLTTKKCTVKGLFNFSTKIIDHDSINSMGRLHIDSLFTNTLLEETIEIGTKNLQKQQHCAWFEKN